MKEYNLFNNPFYKLLFLFLLEFIICVVIFGWTTFFSNLIELHKLIFNNLDDKYKNIFQIIELSFLALIFIIANSIFIMVIVKDDSSIRFYKLKKLEQFENEISSFINLNPCEKETQVKKNNGEENKELYYKNYKFDLYKKYMDILAEI